MSLGEYSEWVSVLEDVRRWGVPVVKVGDLYAGKEAVWLQLYDDFWEFLSTLYRTAIDAGAIERGELEDADGLSPVCIASGSTMGELKVCLRAMRAGKMMAEEGWQGLNGGAR